MRTSLCRGLQGRSERVGSLRLSLVCSLREFAGLICSALRCGKPEDSLSEAEIHGSILSRLIGLLRVILAVIHRRKGPPSREELPPVVLLIIASHPLRGVKATR
jgi:hypothetical protein